MSRKGINIKPLLLSEEDRIKLEQNYRNYNLSRQYRYRCKTILLKAKGMSGEQIAELLDISRDTVYSITKRYDNEGIAGLETHFGQSSQLTKERSGKKVQD